MNAGIFEEPMLLSWALDRSKTCNNTVKYSRAPETRKLNNGSMTGEQIPHIEEMLSQKPSRVQYQSPRQHDTIYLAYPNKDAATACRVVS